MALLVASTMPGLMARSRSYPSTRDSSVPGLKFDSTTSDTATRRSNKATPSGSRRFNPRLRLFRCAAAKLEVIPAMRAPSG
jgi:hypothetical protein